MEKIVRTGKKVFRSISNTKLACAINAYMWTAKASVDLRELGFELKFKVIYDLHHPNNEWSCQVDYEVIKTQKEDI